MAKRPEIDLDAMLLEAMPKLPGNRCTICVALDQLSDDETGRRIRAAINERETYTSDGLVRILVALGCEVTRSSMERHRRMRHG